jgi:hypothetical protein
VGQMQNVLKQLLGCAGTLSEKTLRFPISDEVASSPFENEVKRVYRILGGVLPSIPLNLRAWDLEFDGIAVELDERLHFNRYRSITLASPGYAHLPRFPLDAYRGYCSNRESFCLRAGSYGRKWSNDSCVAQFGAAAPPEDLRGNGSPRWKQRAFYDFVKDLSPLLIGVNVVRIAVWDTVMEGGRSRTVEEVLKKPSVASSAVLAALVKERAAG